MVDSSRHRGRPAVTSRSDLERRALELFAERGFESTSIGDIAEAAGIGRRTFFRYFASKNDTVWGDFDGGLLKLRTHLAAASPDQPLLDALREAVLAFNRLDDSEIPRHRQRIALILNVPALQAHSTLRYAAWRDVVAEFAAVRLQQPAGALLPQLVAHSCLAAALTAYDQWLRTPGSELLALLDGALLALDGSWTGRRETHLAAPETACGRICAPSGMASARPAPSARDLRQQRPAEP